MTWKLIGFLVYLAPWLIQKNWRLASTLGIIGAAVVGLERYVAVPADTGWNLAIGFVVNAALSVLVGPVVGLIRRQGLDRRGIALFAGKLGAVALILLLMFVASAPVFRAGALYRLGNVQVAATGAEAFADIDIKQIVVVPEETARNKGRQVVGQYGSQFSLGTFYLQRYKGDLVYVAPLEPNSLFTQWNAGVSPGYVTVSATDPQQPAKLVSGQKLRYTQEAFLSQWLDRKVRGQAPDTLFVEFSFELDEDGNPWWVGSAGHYAVGVAGVKIDQALIVNPTTGETKNYALDQLPDWVDQAIPESVATEYTEWWGQYENGYWNAAFTQRGVKKLTHVGSGGRAMVGVNGADGRFRYFSGMTSPNPKDTSLIGYMLVDARSGGMTFHQVPGISSEENIVRVVENEYKAQKYAAGYPLPYNIYGRFTWVVPVLDSLENGQWMGVAIVSSDAATVATGKSLPEALRAYKARMSGAKGAGPTDTARLAAITGTVERIAQVTDQGNSVFYMVLTEQPGKVFTAPLGLNPNLAVTRPGDKVVLEYAETTEVMVPVSTFHNQMLER